MNKQGPGKIDYCDYTWNPISGCFHGCDYCYLKRMPEWFGDFTKPTFHENRLKEPLSVKKPSVIFAGSSGDMWGHWVPDKWIDSVLDVVGKANWHTFLFLTKNPARYKRFSIPENAWIGTTVDGLQHTAFNFRAILEAHIFGRKRNEIWISFEPLKAKVFEDPWYASWIVLGRDSNKGADIPPIGHGLKIIDNAKKKKIPVWVKDNWPELPKLKERPF